ncbi:MAG: outer membrane lipoprotein-sorting protein [Fidelibacterota bacterium]|nr:MAG: outer membrane lipoprotein-sorting protein [Candidatus Neomarinimicrobiota bacterium]
MKLLKRSVYVMMPCLIWPLALAAQSEKVPTAKELIEAIDANLNARTSIVTSRMVVHGRRASRTITSRSWVEGTDKAFTEYLAPPREAGTKMLKLGDQLWTYSPQTDRIIQISGHMLRQSLMGSDLSYQDMMEDQSLEDVYDGIVEGSEQLNGRDSWVMTLTAKVEGLAYHTRKAWIDKEWLLPMREELFAKSGKLLKSSYAEEVMQVEGRWYPKVWVFKDELKRNSRGTEWIIDEIAFNQPIPEAQFAKAALRK